MSLTKVSPDGSAVCDCGHAPTEDTLGTGYATDPASGRSMCYPCADAAQLAHVADPEVKRFTAYVNGDGTAITTWTGGKLAGIHTTGTSGGGFHGAEIFHVTAQTADGRTWYGKNGGLGMAINLRAHVRPIY